MNTKKTLYLFFGPPGVGKGTVAQACRSKNLRHVSTGTICRKHMSNGTILGRKLASYIDRGELVPDSLIISLIEEDLLSVDCETIAIILDGFPRTVTQANVLHDCFSAGFLGHYNPIVIVFSAKEEIILERLSKRIICSNASCEKIYNNSLHVPDNCQLCGSILTRLQTYRSHYKTMIDFWTAHKYNVYHVEANEEPHKVLSTFLSITGLTV